MSDAPHATPGLQTSLVPSPDPTALTAVAVTAAKEEMRREIAALRMTLETRLDAMDKAASLLHSNMTQIPTDIDKQIKHLTELHDEKFASVQTQFRERDVRADQDKIAATTAVNAALQAQKEAAASQQDSNTIAIAKSEAATAKQIDGIILLISTNKTAMDDKVGDLKGRLDRGEGVARGGQSAVTERRLDSGFLVVLLALCVAAASVISAVVLHH